MTDKQRKSDIEPLLMTKVTDEFFSTILTLSKEITDYTAEIEEDIHKYDQKNEMALNLDSESESEGHARIILEASDGEPEEAIEVEGKIIVE